MPKFVRVQDWMPPGHIRTPAYLRGKIGEVERELGSFPNPEELAYNRKPAPSQLCRVRFTMAEIWGDCAENPSDTLDAEIYSHWLEPIDAP